MNNSIIVYASTHHGNTRKLAERMARSIGADLADAVKEGCPDLTRYDLVGFASGIYFHSFHESLQKIARSAEFRPGQRVFLADTCGVGYKNYCGGMGRLLEKRGVQILGSFQCRGYDTYGIFGKLGGIAKGHPTEADLERAGEFAKEMRCKAEGGEENAY